MLQQCVWGTSAESPDPLSTANRPRKITGSFSLSSSSVSSLLLLRNWSASIFPGWCLLALIALVTSFAITLSTWSWRQRYRPSPKAFGQLLRICCKDPFLVHSWQLGVSIFPHMCRFVGLGNTSYTDLMRNRISLKSGRQQSDHVTLFSSTSSHLVQALADSDRPFCRNALLLRPLGLLLGWDDVFPCLWHWWYASRGKIPIPLCL